jgi:hypothetical protein
MRNFVVLVAILLVLISPSAAVADGNTCRFGGPHQSGIVIEPAERPFPKIIRDSWYDVYRNEILAAKSCPVNFGGQYILTYWGTGTESFAGVLIDVWTGDVFRIPPSRGRYAFNPHNGFFHLFVDMDDIENGKHFVWSPEANEWTQLSGHYTDMSEPTPPTWKAISYTDGGDYFVGRGANSAEAVLMSFNGCVDHFRGCVTGVAAPITWQVALVACAEGPHLRASGAVSPGNDEYVLDDRLDDLSPEEGKSCLGTFHD